MEPYFSIKHPKRRRPDTDYDACLICQKGAARQSFPSYAETDRSRLSCTPICYHKQKGRSLLQNEVDSHSDFLEKNPVCHARYRSKYANRNTADQKKQVDETRRHFPANVTSFTWIISHCLFLLLQPGSSPFLFHGPSLRSADLALWPVEMFTISCSSHFNGCIIWLLITPVIFFTPSFRLACWRPRGAVLGVIQIQVCHCLCLL